MHQLTQRYSEDGHHLRLMIDMESVEAIMEEPGGCVLVTGSDTYRVSESYDEVVRICLTKIEVEDETTSDRPGSGSTDGS